MESKVVSLFVIFGFVTFSTASVTNKKDCKMDKDKCTAKDQRLIYPRCMLYREDDSLWCDQSNYTKIPDPDTILHYTTCRNVSALYINDSCLQTLVKSDLQKYHNIRVFKCGRNYISELQANLFSGNPNLNTIDFCKNNIKYIKDGAFEGLSQLRILNLANNQLNEISSTMFFGLDSLEELSLHNNKIAVLQKESFLGLKNLKILTLTANGIMHIDEDAFDGLENLKQLHLDENKLQEIKLGTFSKLKNLEVLTISYNKINQWPDFSEVPTIHTLNLAHNLLQEFKSTHIGNLSQLQNLSLENNSLTSLPEDLFRHNSHLRYLNLEKNYLESIDRLTFSRLCHLETLKLGQNRLKTPHAEWFQQVVQNGIVYGNDISGNKWRCGCNILKFSMFLQTLASPWKNSLQINCDSPKELKNKVLDVSRTEYIKRNKKCHLPKPIITDPCNVTVSTTPFVRITTVFTYIPTTTEDGVTTSAEMTETTRTLSTPDTRDTVVHVKSQTAPLDSGIVITVLPFVLSFLIIVLLIVIVRYFRMKNHKRDVKLSVQYEKSSLNQSSIDDNRSDSMGHEYDLLNRDEPFKRNEKFFNNDVNSVTNTSNSELPINDTNVLSLNETTRQSGNAYMLSNTNSRVTEEASVGRTCQTANGGLSIRDQSGGQAPSDHTSQSQSSEDNVYMSMNPVTINDTVPKSVMFTPQHCGNDYCEVNSHLLADFPGIRQAGDGESLQVV
uniref:leucine-rich repeat-containing protein 15-like n=1 Tax=Styela clava TaxID=7725 RepID=UPI00193A1CC9|nr:leucine-rich repeat-containing protein 15-like [Styela clava]